MVFCVLKKSIYLKKTQKPHFKVFRLRNKELFSNNTLFYLEKTTQWANIIFISNP